MNFIGNPSIYDKKLRVIKYQLINIRVDLGMVFKQRFKYQKNEKINFIKVILKLDCLFYQNIYILFNLFFMFVEPFRLKRIQKVV